MAFDILVLSEITVAHTHRHTKKFVVDCNLLNNVFKYMIYVTVLFELRKSIHQEKVTVSDYDNRLAI